jgi:DNA-binding CsgD family transcriptional regulator
VIRAAILSAYGSTRTALREALAPAKEVRIVAEAAGAESLPLEVDVVLVTEDASGSLTQRWEAQVRRNARLRLPAVLLLASGFGGAAEGLERTSRPKLPAAAGRLYALPVHAWGLLRRDANPESLAAAVRALHTGLAVSEPRILSPLSAPPGSLVGPPADTRGGGESPQLTPRETEVLRLLAQGLGNKQIAWELGVSEHTVKFHTSAIYSRLGVANRTEALRRGVELGLLSL